MKTISTIILIFFNHSLFCQPFQEETFYFTAAASKDIISHDLDQDGDLDILVATAEENKIIWFEQVIDEQFTPHVIIENFKTDQLLIEDIDQDGDFDILI